MTNIGHELFQENWSADIHRFDYPNMGNPGNPVVPVIAGVGDGLVHVVPNGTVDTWHTGVDLWHGANHLWHDFTSLFLGAR